MKAFKAEDMQIGVPGYVPGEEDRPVRTGIVTLFKDDKGFGFIRDLQSGESIFVHASQLAEPVKENNKVSFDVEQGPRG